MSAVTILPARKVDPHSVRPAADAAPVEAPPAVFGDSLRRSIAAAPAWSSPRPPYVPFAAAIQGASVVSPPFSVFTPERAVVKESLYLTSVEEAVAGLDRYPRRGFGAPAAFLAANKSYGHYYHWTTQCLAALSLITAGTWSGDCRIVCGPLADWQKRSLELAGFPEGSIDELESRSVTTFERLIYPSLLARRDHAVWPGMKPLYRSIRSAADRSERFAERIYVSRQDATDRPLINEAELAAQLARLGFRTVVGGKLSVDQQVSAFAGAKVIVAPHGAGLSNIVYCEPGTAVYELHPSHYVKSCYYWLSQLFELAYWGDCFGPIGAGEVAKADRHGVSWSVDVPSVLDRVETILASR